jgi:hypothetical protein
MAGLDPAIHVLGLDKTWMPATSAGMTFNIEVMLGGKAPLIRPR